MNAYYLKFSKGHSGSESRIGGQPTLLPSEKPWTEVENDVWGFLLQIAVQGLIHELPEIAYIQLYQSVFEGDDPCPEAILIGQNSKINEELNVLTSARVGNWDITLEKKEEPDEVPKPAMSPAYIEIFSSKIGGLDPYEKDGYTFLAQIGEEGDLNFGGMMCSIYIDPYGEIITELN